MPHVIVKLLPGRTDEVKTNLAKKIAQDVSEEAKVDYECVSVAFEEVALADWDEEVQKKDIEAKADLLYKKATK